jgi:Protein of unknown function (DUF1353)
MKTDPSELVTWSVQPVFSLINDGYFNQMICTTAGEARLGHDRSLVFPLGWRTDITSTPWYFSSLLSQLGPHAPAAIIHDRLLNLGFSRAYAWKWMRLQLRQLPRVTRPRRWFMLGGTWLYDVLAELGR